MEYEEMQKLHKDEVVRGRREQERTTRNYSRKSGYGLAVSPLFTAAIVVDYIKWMKGYLEKGGKPTHHHDSNMPWGRGGFLVAKCDFELDGECGANACNIIVPEGVKFLGGDMGHCNLYFMEDFSVKGGCVPTYNDM